MIYCSSDPLTKLLRQHFYSNLIFPCSRPLGLTMIYVAYCVVYGSEEGTQGVFLAEFMTICSDNVSLCYNVTIYTANCIPIISDQREISHHHKTCSK